MRGVNVLGLGYFPNYHSELVTQTKIPKKDQELMDVNNISKEIDIEIEIELEQETKNKEEAVKTHRRKE